MKKSLLVVPLLILLAACSTTQNTSSTVTPSEASGEAGKHKMLNENAFLITEISKDPTYGLTPENPVEVGGTGDSEGPLNERRYLNGLTGPNGETLSYYRKGSCCPIRSDHAIFGDHVMLDEYEVTWSGLKVPISIYINMYDSGKLMAPVGLGVKKY